MALAESAMAGGLGVAASVVGLAPDGAGSDLVALFSESTTRFLVEVRPADLEALRAAMGPHALHDMGAVTAEPRLEVTGASGASLISLDLAQVREAFHGSFAG